MMIYNYAVGPNDITLRIEGAILTIPGKIVDLTKTRYAISYYPGMHRDDHEIDLWIMIKESRSGKNRAHLLDNTLPIKALDNYLGGANYPVYLDLVDPNRVRTLVQINLKDLSCQDFLNQVIAVNPDGYLGFGTASDTRSALDLNPNEQLKRFYKIDTIVTIAAFLLFAVVAVYVIATYAFEM